MSTTSANLSRQIGNAPPLRNVLQIIRFGLTVCVLLSSRFALGQAANSPTDTFRIAGYLPDYRLATFEPADVEGITDLILFSARPKENGELDLGALEKAPWEKLWKLSERQRMRLVLSIGGWERSQGFATVAASARLREKFARSIVALCADRRLAGVDLDWEHPQNEREQADYAKLLETLRDQFRQSRLKLSLTMADWQQLPPTAFAAVDWVQVMAYDHDGRHSTIAHAKQDVESLLKRDIPAEKIILGLPFYGRHVKERSQAMSYGELATKYSLADDVDEVDGYYFNGPKTLRDKVRYARESKLGGVMIWELGQDRRGDASLLRVITDEARRK
ncbi:MAG: glycoside hydrolase family 18 protein [Planctomycetota bacterium]|nr:glycoside hydrolase family 18 protein [Planctomycetota bacterium]